MIKEQMLKELKEIISVYVPEQGLLKDLSDDKDLINDLKINSAHIVDIVLDIEDKYDIMIEDDAIAKMSTIGQSIEVVMEKLKNK